MKNLIIYYSLGQNTEKVAQLIHENLCDSLKLRIETIEAYPDDEDKLLSQTRKEINKGFMPKITDLNIEFEDVKNIIIGSPYWHGCFAPPLATFIEKYKKGLKEKNIYAFFTTEGDDAGIVEKFQKEFKNNLNDLILKTVFSEDKTMVDNKEKITQWISTIK